MFWTSLGSSLSFSSLLQLIGRFTPGQGEPFSRETAGRVVTRSSTIAIVSCTGLADVRVLRAGRLKQLIGSFLLRSKHGDICTLAECAEP